MDAAKRWLEGFDDGGKNKRCRWKRGPGGAKTRLLYACDEHEDCAVRVHLLGEPGGAVACEMLRGKEHGDELKVYDRSNASITIDERRMLHEGMRWGATAKKVCLEIAKDDGDAGAHSHACTHIRHASMRIRAPSSSHMHARASAIRRIRVPPYAFAHIRLHS